MLRTIILVLLLLFSNTDAYRLFAQNTTYGYGGAGFSHAVAPPTGIPVPPPGSVAFKNLQNSGGGFGTWQQCSGSACAGGSEGGSGSLTFNNASPSLSGGSMKQTSTGGSSPGHNSGFNVLYYLHIACSRVPTGLCTWVNNAEIDEYYYIPSTTLSSNLEAPEFDPDMFFASYRYLLSVQCQTSSGKWRIWHDNDDAGHGWVITPYSCTSALARNVWHHLQIYGTMNTTTHKYCYQGFAIDDITIFSALGTCMDARFTTKVANSKTLNVEQQIDNKPAAGSNSIYYDNINFYVWHT